MQLHTIGKPCFENLEAWEKSPLLDPLVEVIKDFYTHEKNRQAYQEWLANGKPMRNQKGRIRYEQTQMAI